MRHRSRKQLQSLFALAAVVAVSLTLAGCAGLTSSYSPPSPPPSSAPQITTTSFANGQVGVAYQANVAATGGTTPYYWSVVSGALPAGLTLNASSGAITGTPSVSGPSSFTVQVRDSAGTPQMATKALTITIASAGALQITTSSLPNGQVQVAYSATLSATGGTTPYSWSVVSGALPTGLTLNASSGAITGTPSASGPFSFTAQVRDSAGTPQTATKALTITIASAGALQITTSSLPNGQVQVAYSATLTATGGTTPYTWTVASGLLPAGLTLNASSGAITGTPTVAGQFSFTVQVGDSGSPAQTATKVLTMSVSTSSGPLDQYGGLLAKPSPKGATGFFRTEKFGNHWMFVSPAGNAFFMFGIQNIGDYFFIPSKYNNDRTLWATQVRRRMKSWNFNAATAYASYDVMLGTTDQLPFIFPFRPSNNAMRNSGGYATEAVKELLDSNVPLSIYDWYRGILIDAYDPKYPGYAAAFFNSDYNLTSITGGANNPWLIGYTTEDGDEWFGVTVADGPDTDVVKAHPAWTVLVSRDPTVSSANPGGYGQQTYTDTTNYSKLALRDFLKTRYNNDINALNVAWGSTYTSWDHAGGWGVGTGFLDEAAQHPWVCASRPCPMGDWNTLNSMTATAKTDMNDFLEQFTEKLCSVAVNAIRAQDKNHLIFSPDTMNQWGYVSRTPVLKAAAKWFDVLHVGYQEGPIFTTQRKAAPRQTYDITGKPMAYWIGFHANLDSGMFSCPPPYGVDSAPTQVARGQKYAIYLANLWNARDANGDYFSVGIDWWGWMDQGNECTNWGLVSGRDNAYDGKEAVIALGVDSSGFRTGGEKRDYGDFLTAVKAANLKIYEALGMPQGSPEHARRND